jgi:hypothetical protein
MMYVYSLALNNASYAKTCTDVLSANEIDTSFITASVSHGCQCLNNNMKEVPQSRYTRA